MSEANISYQEHAQYVLGEDPVKYRVGSLVDDGHVHYIYVRDSLPIGTTNNTATGRTLPHQHHITGESFEAMVCNTYHDHTHTAFTVIALDED